MQKQQSKIDMSERQSISNISASSLANYLLNENKYTAGKITNIHLHKIIYIIHGFSLAIENTPIINSEFDEKIEAWKLGPVIPSIYHEMKEFGNAIIKQGKKSLLTEEINDNKVIISEPYLPEDHIIKYIAKWVVEKILVINGKIQDAEKLVKFTHLEGSPWHEVYRPGTHNILIDNKSIKEYFDWYKDWLYDNYKVAFKEAENKEGTYGYKDRSLEFAATNYILDKLAGYGIKDVTNLKLQKLLYFAYGINLLLYKQKLFQTSIQAWKLGPVVPEVYKEFKNSGNKSITTRAYTLKEDGSGDINLVKYTNFTENEKKSLDIACNAYAHKRAWALVDITNKKHSAWFKVYKENVGNISIPDNLIKEEFNQYIETLAEYLLTCNEGIKRLK